MKVCRKAGIRIGLKIFKNNGMKKVYTILMLGLLAFAPKRLFDSTPQSLPFTQNWTNTGLITVNDDWSGVPGIQGFLGDDGSTTTAGVDPQTILIDNTTIDVIANQANPNTNTSGGVAEFQIADPVVALQGSGTADYPNIIIYLNTTSLQNINVAYNLRDIDGSADNAVQPIALQYRVGNSGNFTNIPAGFVADATTGPSIATLVTPVSVQLPSNCNNQAEVQVRIITYNAAGSDEWVGIDDINITGSPLSGNSANSDIIANGSFSAPPNINYLTYQANDITDANSIEVAQFIIRDGGAAADADAVGTILTNLSMSLSNSANIRRVALYDGTTELGEVAGGATVSFSGLTLTAPDDGTKTFSVRVTFNTAVTDNQQFQFAITGATADPAGSGFAAGNAGGATSSIAVDDNRIEVTADRLAYGQNTTTPTGLNVAMTPAVTLRANDINANIDLDFASDIQITSTGTLAGSPVIVTASNGTATFSTLTHTATGTGLTLNAEREGSLDWDIVSDPFDIIVASSATDYFRSAAPSGGNWGIAASWESSPDNATWNPSTLSPDANANTITIRNGHTITVSSAAGGDQIVVEAGATLVLNAAFTLVDGTGTDMDVSGTVINSAGTHVFTGTVAFNANSLYQHNRNGGAVPTAIWNVTSTLEVTGGTSAAPTNLTQTLGNFTWNSNTTTTTNLTGSLTTVAGNFRVQNSGTTALRLSGTADLNLSVSGNFTVEDDLDIDNNSTGVCNISIGGNFSHTAGTFQSSVDVASITLTGVAKTFSQSGGTFNGTNINWIINSTSAISLLTDIPVSTGRSLTVDGALDAAVLQITGAGAVTVNGALATSHVNGIGATGTLANTGTITIGAASFIVFNAAGAQTFTGRSDYANVIINGGGNKSLDNNAALSGNLTLNNGKAELGTNNLVVGGTVSGGSATNYVVTNSTGTITINNIGAAGVVFPIGISRYNPLTIANGSNLNWTVRVEDVLNNVLAPFNTDKAVLRTWTITPSTNPPPSGADLTFQYDDGDPTQIGPSYITTENVQVWHYNFAWIAASSPMAPTGSAGGVRTVTRTGWSNFSSFAIANMSGPLPVTILHFSGYKDGARNQLRWSTATEVNNRGFEVQRSTDGIHFSPIGFVNSLAPGGNSSDQLSYSFTDNAPAGSKQYYRLRQEDLAGAVRLSNIVLIRGGKPTGLTIDALFPNPAKNDVNLQLSSPANDKVTILVTDMAGRNILQQVAGIGAGSNTLVLDISSLQRGIYLLRIVGKDGVLSEGVRFVK